MRRDDYRIFSEGKIGSLTLPNRLVRSATWDPSILGTRKMTDEVLSQHSYQTGQRFRYPQDTGKLCPWLLSAMDTIEFVHCPDPASGIVVKLIRTAIED